MGRRLAFEIGPFTDVEPDWGNRLWEFLNRPPIVLEMINASDRQRPAAEAIAQQLHAEVGDDVRQHRVRQFTGFLIRQVMERNGYQHIRYGRRALPNPIFFSASLYSRRDG